MDRTLALGVILSLQDRISPALSNVLGRVRNLSQSTSKYQQQIKNLEKQAGGIKSLQKLQRDLGDSGRKMDDARHRVEALGRQMAGTATPTATLTRQFEAARRELNRLQESHGALTNRANAARQALRDQGIDTRVLGDEHQRLRDQIEQTTRQLDDYNAAIEHSSQLQAASSTIAKVGTVAAAIGAATGGVLKPAVAAFTEMEDAGTDMKVSMMKAGGAVSENFEKINALAQNLGNRLPGTTAELQGMMTTLIQQGASEQAILGGLGEASANLGVVLKKPYQDAAEFAAKLQDATGATEDQMMGLMDVVQRTFYLGTDADNMLAGMTKLSPAMDILKRKGLDVANTRRSGDTHHFQNNDRDAYTGVKAKYHNKHAAKEEAALAGGDETAKTLPKLYANEKEAQDAADAEQQRLQRGKSTLSLTLAIGRPDLVPENPIKVSGFKAEIDAVNWITTQLTHSLNESGLTTALELESEA